MDMASVKCDVAQLTLLSLSVRQAACCCSDMWGARVAEDEVTSPWIVKNGLSWKKSGDNLTEVGFWGRG